MNYLSYLFTLEKFGINLGLHRISHLLKRLNNPQDQFQSIHIAGTNGKGSTAAMLASILAEAGYKVGLYTSPHFLEYNERIKINGENISDKDLEEGIRKVKKAVEEMRGRGPVKAREGRRGQRAEQPTVFEVLTAAAFWYFAKHKIDYAIVEVGMGGRLDATNVIIPLVSIITNIALEHTDILGKSLADIAKEKAGIIKPGVPVITAETKKGPLNVIRSVCKRFNSPWSIVHGPLSKLHLSLPGPHQQTNAACALAALRLAKIPMTKAAIQKGLKNTKWPGRFQIPSRKPLIIIDGAHNPAGAKALRVTISQLYPGKRFTVIFGCQKTKQYPEMLRQLKPIADKIIITRSSSALAAKEEDVFFCARKDCPQALPTHSFRRAYQLWDRKTSLLICGSLFLAADALKCLDGLPQTIVE
ncbi:MAG: folylpolyglutamate synthase/dihydrofolate synthase family protein [Candidatus Margulisbacteria bacterium]|nr:folylpolyglutamate synthase/dihydrofolate synthase family protein [Candidatus Margulisiibacteriota bacterium]